MEHDDPKSAFDLRPSARTSSSPAAPARRVARRTRAWRRADAPAVGLLLLAAAPACADEGGVSFWLPGMYGSFAAAPAQPGLSIASFYVHPDVSAGGSKVFLQGGRFELGISGRFDAFAINPSYTFATPVFGGQAAIGLMAIGGRNATSVGATLTGPDGSLLSGEKSQSTAGFGDLYPQANLRWNDGVNNFMVYMTGGVPIGSYDSARIANIGVGHGAIDAGVGYTYLNPANKLEFSAVGGFTYNFVNPSTRYQNGVDAHLDLAASYSLNQTLNVGVVGYVYQQVTGDHGFGASLGGFESSAVAVGPQVNIFFPVGDHIQGVMNAKVYKDIAANNRASGWNAWLTLAFSPAPPSGGR